ncbi:hypothetical protein J7L49_06405 [Candidatus Bathyarchaeota archaeon]|nr:hypothetical protein [Candidatus Bathyarchaeota archaeon]
MSVVLRFIGGISVKIHRYDLISITVFLAFFHERYAQLSITILSIK